MTHPMAIDQNAFPFFTLKEMARIDPVRAPPPYGNADMATIPGAPHFFIFSLHPGAWIFLLFMK